MSDQGLRHVVHRRTHLERAQPKARAKLGLLEKHKDYVKRAKNFHMKEDTVKKLQQKAYFKNTDEFYHNMLSKKVVNGRVRDKDHHLSQDEFFLAESQDSRYIGMREQSDLKAVEKMKAKLHFLDAERPNKHVVFLDDDDIDKSTDAASGAPRKRQRLKDVSIATYFDTQPELMARKANRLKTSQLATGSFTQSEEAEQEAHRAYKELFHRQERARKLGRVREELEQRKALRSKGKKKKVVEKSAKGPAVYKWAQERKR